MSLPAQRSVFSIAPQAAKLGTGAFVMGDYTWYRYRAPRIGISAIQSQPVFPMETGGPIVPTGSYKDMAMFAGDIDMFPRAEGDFGWLLYAAMGAASSVATVASTGTYYTHHFRFASDGFTIPWIAARKFVPGLTAADNFGEYGYDCKVAALTLNVPAAGLISANVVLQGRVPGFAENPSWTYADEYEDTASVPVSGNGFFKIAGTEYPITGLSLEFINGLSTPQQEMVVGSYFFDDAVPLSRGGSIRMIYKYENPDLWQSIYANDPAGLAFDPLPFTRSTSGAVYAVEGQFSAPQDMPGISPATKYGLQFTADKVTLAPGRPAQLAAGGLIMYEYIATLLDPGTGYDYIDLKLINKQSAYSWPT